MGVDVQGCGAGGMPDDGGQGLYIHTMLQSVGGENMTQVVESHFFTSSVLQDLGQPVADNGRGNWSVLFFR